MVPKLQQLLFAFLGNPWTLKDPFLATGHWEDCVCANWFTASQAPQFCLHFELNSLVSFIHNALYAVHFSIMASTKQK